MRTRGVKDGDDYILNGEKAWITSGTIADVAVVWARTDEGVRGFLVEKGTPGYSAKDIKGKWSLRASVTSSLSLQDVRVPAAQHASQGAGTEGAVELPDSGALRHRLGRHRGRHGLLQRGAGIRQGAQAV